MPSPVGAVVHPNPYPYYAAMVAERPFHFDEQLDTWVAASAAAAQAVLAAPGCRVRPPHEPVPQGITGTPAGDVFGNLVRMTDGEPQHRLKAIVTQTLGAIDRSAVAATAMQRARQVLNDSVRTPYEQLMFELPAQVVATLCGLDPAAGGEATRLVGHFVQCIPATASPEQQQRAAQAAAGLQELLGPKLDDTQHGLLGELVRMATHVGWTDRAPLLANGIGFLSQTYDATAALMGNTLLALSQQECELPTSEMALQRFVREVIRHDAPIQNTRRFTATPIRHGDVEVPAGQAVLVLLAAANRDPAANPDPHMFRADRTTPNVFTFSAGAHHCPGETLAVTIVTTVVEQLLRVGFDPAKLSTRVTYRPSPNARIPVLTE
ncbi:cytochrome P450 [Salinispora oceanensis]|uniref:cytochrome P450 n=1 Tax=Salinispora oceanensis TaxID=1050199 RepID=UPI00165FBEAF|nr:cytochrome P450 [Salinispora oceanensis]